jgi:rRNA maturation RNase YbeY
VECDPALSGPQPAPTQALLTQVLKTEGVKNADVTLIFGDDDLLNRLKRQFFGLDHLTDVLAFRLNDADEPKLEGEIYISLPRAQENAHQYQEPYAKELARLMIHGGLHLLDYEDGSAKEQAIMRAKENQYLDQFPWLTLVEMDGES